MIFQQPAKPIPGMLFIIDNENGGLNRIHLREEPS
jgi:hypothetical protein